LENKIVLLNNQVAQEICGYQDRYLRMIEKKLKTQLLARGNEITVVGTDLQAEQTLRTLKHLEHLAKDGVRLTPMAVNYALSVCDEADPALADLLTRTVFITAKGRTIKAKGFGQWQYIQAIQTHDLTFGIGPAGTGKTFLGVMQAVNALKHREVSRIVLARPAVEAGEKLGFLPGDLQEKVSPYLRPLYDALDEALGMEQSHKLIERGVIEVVPLAYMRGRTLDDAFIILDEAQNTTGPQMKMFLTRIGQGSKAVVTGDLTQIDLPNGQTSGLKEAEEKLRHVEGIMFCRLTKVDVVRHPLVQRIIEAYEQAEDAERA